ncbi:tRNA lysidine(34) synthetase TilS [Neisseria chenwenguii]|uniref:tRNA(Ile)-lysidine synthase n=1 Tax=Neisseria chenwenguii TaxID=1853278 RepID=A0A220S4X3_9NEIS|nr:tRNA lysidine(34) synthetase TilS [Neisseria chenwenguii]ASK28579.1 tRNA lysidine(34) synthetase TilS [Neisseria chenwenguii]
MKQKMDIFPQFASAFPDFPAGIRIEAALSGGLDSVVLLHLLAQMRTQRVFELSAVHVHHGLSTNADEWAAFCQNYCGRLGVPLRVCRVRVEKNGLGVEAAARSARYSVFSDGLCDVVALAHHQNDQTETFMLAALRGGGMRALAAMPVWRSLNRQTKIWRPLLSFSREDLQHYAAEHGLDYVDDESNGNPAFLRNWLRNEALPAWRQRIPELDKHILANVRSLQDDLALLDEIAAEDFQAVCADGFFAVDKWRRFSQARRLRLLWKFVKHHNGKIPTHSAIRNFEQVLHEADSCEWQLDGARIFAYRNCLYWFDEDVNVQTAFWKKTALTGRLKDILMQTGFVLKPHPQGLPESVLNEDGIIRCVGGGDMLRINGRQKPVKKLLQESHILPFVRKKWPIITRMDNTCLAVGNLKVSQDFQTANGFLPVCEELNQYLRELNFVK